MIEKFEYSCRVVGELIECFFSLFLGFSLYFTDLSLNACFLFNFPPLESIYNLHFILRVSQYRLRVVEVCLMRIKCIKNRLKTSRYECSPRMDRPMGRLTRNGQIHESPHLARQKIGLSIWSRGLRDRSMGHPTACHKPKQIRTDYPIKGDDPVGLPHFVPTQFFLYLRFETYQNTTKCS